MKQHNFLKQLLFPALGVLLILASCDDKQSDSDSDQELITTVTLTLTPAGGGTPVTVSWRDLDGDGGASPTIGTLALRAGTVYNGTISLLNESETPAENITEEVEEEKEEHQFFYTFSPQSLCTVDNLDTDANSLPVGLTFRFTVPASGPVSGTLNVKLGHYDDVAKNGTTLSDENDINIDIPVTVSAAS